MGDIKYPAGFKHYSYVNPNAPKGGLLRLGVDGTFDSFNHIITRGTVAAGVSTIYDTLMTASLDEVATEYGLIAESVRYPADYSSVTYRLRASARWHDGKPITPEDVIWTFEMLKQHNPQRRYYYRHVVKAEKTGERDVTFTFDEPGNRELPQIVGQIAPMPKHWWTGKDPQGKERNIANATLEPPLGSGAYKLKSFIPGRTIVYERVKDYWAATLPVRIGHDNFDELRYEYFRDDSTELIAFKADEFDFRAENVAKNWATAYDIPAVKEKRLLLETFPDRARGVMQAFVFNLRREKFTDPRVRLALNYAMNFENMNRNFFYGQYERIASYFSGTELASSGLPQGKELEILESVRGQVPPEVFTATYKNPVFDKEESVRGNLRQAAKLLREAGYEVRDGKLVNAKTGEPFTIEFLIASPSFDRIILFYGEDLKRLGIQFTVRQVDVSQYQNRVRSRDFDAIVSGWGQSLSPGNEQYEYFGSESADRDGSSNYAGIKNPAVDTLIKRVVFAKDRGELLAATRALDRVLMWNHYVVPMWSINVSRIARWDRFGKPDKLPEYNIGFPDIWWFDKDRAAKVGPQK
ncbi:MAG: ABC transporter substrate-binding protein [Rhizobiales bacterium]|nr:ABC transporter substrate-binding protein [Hyphomicrobiales bacterium]